MDVHDTATLPASETSAAPHLALLHGCMFLSGFGTIFLGPTLPALAASAGTSDSGSGLFFAAQFLGAFLGGLTTNSRLWFCLLRGSAAAAFGFAALSQCARLHTSLPWTAAALLPLGFGVGQMLTSLNLLASRSLSSGRASALSLVNLSWSLGAVVAPIALGGLLGAVPLSVLLASVGGCFALAVLAAARNASHGRCIALPHLSAARARLPRTAFLYFAALLLLYGGVETCLSGWVTTFGIRYGSGSVQTSALGATALWIGITAGRGLAAVLLQRIREGTLLTAALSLATLLVVVLSQAHGPVAITVTAGLLGMALAPWFPVVLSAMLGEGATAGETGTIIAVSGLGAASLPLLLGIVSRSSGSLRIALAVPLTGLLLLLLLSLRKSTAAHVAG